MDELATVLESLLGIFERNANDEPPIVTMEAQEDFEEDNGVDVVGLQEACQLLYLGSHSMKLAATMLLMNICTIHGVNNKFVDELLTLLHKHLLHVGNCLPIKMYHAKTLTKKVGFNYKIIHACPSGCVLFWGGYAKLNACPKCGLAWYKDVGRSKLPKKVLKHFPFILQLK